MRKRPRRRTALPNREPRSVRSAWKVYGVWRRGFEPAPPILVVIVRRDALRLQDPNRWKLETDAMEYTGSQYIGDYVDGR